MEEDSSTSHGTVESAADRSTENPTLGEYDGREVQLAVRRDPPGAAYPDEFAVNLYVPCADGTNVDIARVDTAHGFIHIDRLYLPEGHERRKHDEIGIERPAEAVVFFTDEGRWREWMRRYDRNHGLP